MGDFSLSFEQSKAQFAIWAIMASVSEWESYIYGYRMASFQFFPLNVYMVVKFISQLGYVKRKMQFGFMIMYFWGPEIEWKRTCKREGYNETGLYMQHCTAKC